MTNLTATILFKDEDGEKHEVKYENVRGVSRTDKDLAEQQGVKSVIIICFERADDLETATFPADSVVKMDINLVPTIIIEDI